MAHHKPVIDQRAAEQMNLNVLKRIDPQIEELLATAGHVALYDFDIPTKRWSRKDVEGSLFLVKRRSAPRFQFIILNKKSAVATDNFVEELHGGFQCEVQKPYVLYRNRANEVVGIWFYDDSDCDRISALLTRIAATFAAPSEAPAGTALPPPEPEPEPLLALPSAEDSNGGDAGFWDKRVQVPDDTASSSLRPLQPVDGAYGAAPGAGGLLVPPQPQAAEPPGGSSNDLARLFAGMKVAAPPAPAAPPAAPRVAAPPPAAPLMLLTPQLLQQEAAGGEGEAAPAPAAAPGNVLLQSLLRGAQPPAAPPAPRPVDITEAADRVLCSKVSSLLSSLADNEAFCGVLATELKRAGLV